MIVTKRTKLPDDISPEHFEQIENQLRSLTNAARNDKVAIITDFLFGDKEEYDDVTNEDFKDVKFLGVFCNEEETK